ncbi:MAG: molecular chaperone TorD family protein [Eggerthellaceae bacterium]
MFNKERQTAVPYESVFTGEAHHDGRRDDVVARFLERIQANPDLHEPEDHLAFELEYPVNMNRRAGTGAGEEQSSAAPQRGAPVEFIEQHLLN